MTSIDTLTIRVAREGDERALRHLAALDSARPLTGDVLLAESAGRPLAAVAIADGATTADPFAPTAHVVDMLETRATQLRSHTTVARPRRGVLRAAVLSGRS